ncbi:tyrosine-type recombinase/integrase [candidate division KSB1 bacterium]
MIITLQKLFQRACANVGLNEKYSIHSTRHTMGFLLLKKTKNLRLVQKQLRHSSPQITAAFYADVALKNNKML